jgi:hypothetical protein
MSAVFTIAARELKERSRIFIAAVLFAILPFAVFFIPTLSQNRNDSLLLGAMIISVAGCLGVAVTIGFTIIGRELSERRLAFYFSRPISSTALWAGKMLAGIVLILGTLLIIATPAIFVARSSWRQYVAIDMTHAFMGVAALALLIFLFANVGSTLVRSRSARLGIDALLLVVTLLLFAALGHPLYSAGAISLAEHVGVVLSIALAVLFAGAVLYQLRTGRVDRIASHTAVSRFVWTGMAVILLVTTAFVFWVTHPAMNELLSAEVRSISIPKHAVIYGRTKGRDDYHAIFDYDIATQRAVRLPMNDPLAKTVASSRDGSRIAYAERSGNAASASISYFSKAVSSNSSILIGSTIGSKRRGVLFSDDASRALFLNDDTLSIIDCRNGHSVATMRVPQLHELDLIRAWFLDNDHVIVNGVARDMGPATDLTVRLFSWDIAANRMTPLANVTNPGPNSTVVASRDGRTMLIRFIGKATRMTIVLDVLTGKEIGRISDPEMRGLPHFLADGRIAATRIHGTAAFVAIYSPAGVVVKTIPLGDWETARITGQLADGTLCVGVTHSTEARGRPSTLAVDVERGGVVREWKQFQGPYGNSLGYLDPRACPDVPLFRDPTGRIAQLDLTSGRAHVLSGAFDIDTARAIAEGRGGVVEMLQDY